MAMHVQTKDKYWIIGEIGMCNPQLAFAILTYEITPKLTKHSEFL